LMHFGQLFKEEAKCLSTEITAKKPFGFQETTKNILEL